jgi:flavodoxin
MDKILVAYFSAGGSTKRVAEKLANGLKADLFAIEPEVAYERADLDWTDSGARSTIEMNDPKCRPAIARTVEGMNEYATVFVGFPIWWYQEPRIIDTFMEQYDFSGKKVIPIATSGMSPLGNSAKNMAELAPGADVIEGKRVSSGISEEEITAWAKTLIG